jgi:hypothetical protein
MTSRGLDPDFVGRLSKLLAMCGSSHDGEVINAARMADRLVRQRGMTWAQILIPMAPAPMPSDDSVDWQVFARKLLREHAYALPEKEVDFCTTMSMWDGEPSPKQQKWLRDIAARFARAA